MLDMATAERHKALRALAAIPNRLSPFLTPGDGVLDLGANVGEYARDYAQRVGPDGYVLAVEADPDTAALCALLAQETPQVHVLPVAVSDRCGVTWLHRDATNIRRQSLSRANLTHDSPARVLVPTMTLDMLARAVPKLAAIKMDLQGAEYLALCGGHAMLAHTHLTWCVELWPQGLERLGGSAAVVARIFREWGWEPVGQTWADVQAAADAKPHGVQNPILQHRTRG